MLDAIMTMMHPPGPDTCEPIHDPAAFYLSLFISIGLLVSYLPQHGRIIYNRSSEGIDPMFLLLGSTSSASSLLNILALSWSAVRCCPFLTRSACLESLMGVFQIGLQWLCFNLVFILFLIYYPVSQKFVSWVPGQAPPPQRSAPSRAWRTFKRMFRPANFAGTDEYEGALDTPASEASSFDFDTQVQHDRAARNASAGIDGDGRGRGAKIAPSPEWRTSTTYAVIAALQLAICAFVTFLLLLTLPKASQPPTPQNPDPLPGRPESRDARVVRLWATFLGILSTVLALFQYLPQIRRTWQRKLVGSLSIPMMLIQTPGSFVFVYSMLLRAGANWTTWLVFLITGLLQGVLLGLCIAWTFRQRRLGIDAYGKPLGDGTGAGQRSNDETRPLLQ